MKKALSISLLVICLLVELLAYNLPSNLTLKEQIDLFCLYTAFGFSSLIYSVFLYLSCNSLTDKFVLTYRLFIQYLLLSSINALIDEIGIGGCNPIVYQLSEFIIFIIITLIFIKKITQAIWQKAK